MKSKKNKLKSLLRQKEYDKKQALKEQKKEAKNLIMHGVIEDNKIVIPGAFMDRVKKEVVAQMNQSQVLEYLTKLKKFEGIALCAIPEIEEGEVLIDHYGTGFYQTQSFGGAN